MPSVFKWHCLESDCKWQLPTLEDPHPWGSGQSWGLISSESKHQTNVKIPLILREQQRWAWQPLAVDSLFRRPQRHSDTVQHRLPNKKDSALPYNYEHGTAALISKMNLGERLCGTFFTLPQSCLNGCFLQYQKMVWKWGCMSAWTDKLLQFKIFGTGTAFVFPHSLVQ